MKDIYQEHPRWKELESLCHNIEVLTRKAKELRAEIDKDVFANQDKSQLEENK